eukprot:4696137-Prymnesium_polylepis.1
MCVAHARARPRPRPAAQHGSTQPTRAPPKGQPTARRERQPLTRPLTRRGREATPHASSRVRGAVRPQVSLNLFFVHADFHNAHRIIHGSHMQQLALVVRSALTGRLLTLQLSAAAAPPHKAYVRDGATGELLKAVTHGSGGFSFENLEVTWREKRFGLIGSHGSVVTVSTGRWLVEATSRAFPNPARNPGKALLDVQ